MNAQSILWFVISLVACVSGVRLLVQRYVQKTPRAIQSRGSYTLFAIFMLMFSFGALVAGLASL